MIKIIYAVVNEVMPDTFEDNLVFAPGEYEIMLFDVPVLIEVNGEMRQYPEHTCVFYEPGQHVHYRALEGELTYTWIRFDCDEPLYKDGFLPFGVPIYIPDYECYKVYWRDVANENFWQHPSGQYVLEQLMHIIFHRLHDYAYHQEVSPYRQSFMELRDNIYQHPEEDWTLESMAAAVNLSVRSLQKLYKQFFHLSCMQEVINSRITRAKVYLRATGKSILEISQQCGYHNMEHFCRQFKNTENMTPSAYRKEVSGKNITEKM